MELAVGEIFSGKVTGITKFGAFVSLPQGKSGMVHISEIDHSYVSNIHDHLTEGQEVKVKVIAIDENGRVNLSIKKAQPRPESAGQRQNGSRNGGQQRFHNGGTTAGGRKPQRSGAAYMPRQQVKEAPATFEDKLKLFMQDSESRMADIRHNRDKKTGARRRK